MINEAGLFLGQPQNFKDKFKVYPPTVSDVVNNEKFSLYTTVFLTTHEELEDEFINKKDEEGNPLHIPTPLEFILASAFYNKEFEELVKEAFYFFTHEVISLLYDSKQILIGDLETEIQKVQSLEELILLEEEDFFDFQNCIRNCLGMESKKPYVFETNEKIRKMKAKARYRDKIKAKKEGLTLDTLLISICCMGIGITPLTVGELSYATFSKLISIYQEKEKYEVDIRSLLAGASSKDVKPKYWIHNSDKK